jgi:hypothetical protein
MIPPINFIVTAVKIHKSPGYLLQFSYFNNKCQEWQLYVNFMNRLLIKGHTIILLLFFNSILILALIKHQQGLC